VPKMEYDIVLTSLPAYNSLIPSFSLASLQSFLSSKGFRLHCVDCSFDFYHGHLKNFKLPTEFQDQKELKFGNWGYANWFIFRELLGLSREQVQLFIESLGPVCSKLYQTIFTKFEDQKDKTIRILDRYVEYLEKFDTDLFGFSIVVGNAVASIYVANCLKRRNSDIKIILGGPEASNIYRGDFYARLNSIDAVIHHNEGELPLFHILRLKKEKLKIQGAPGITFFSNGSLIKTESPPALNLDELPIPAYNSLDLVNQDFRNVSSLRIFCSKGCPSNCVFCNDNSIWGPFRVKKPTSVVREIEYYNSVLGINEIALADNSFNSTTTFRKALDILKSTGISIEWGGNAEFRGWSDEKIVNYSRDGLKYCYFGLESGSHRVLKLMNKLIDLDDASRIIKKMDEMGVRVGVYVMVGFPGETLEDFSQTLEFLQTHDREIQDFLVSVFTLQKGSAMFNNPLVQYISIEPPELNAWIYRTQDGTSHEDRKQRFQRLKKMQFFKKKQHFYKLESYKKF